MTKNKLNLAILISGRGSNMQALVQACRNPDFPARVSVVISNNPGAPGLAFAQAENIAAEVVDHRNFSGKSDFEASLLDALDRHPVDLVCLAGFMRLLSGEFIKRRQGRIINIHPSLLPAYKGLRTHERALADKAAETGCTVHYVTEDMDAGPIILQKKVPILPGDTPESLSLRVLEQEHLAYPEAVRAIAQKPG